LVASFFTCLKNSPGLVLAIVLVPLESNRVKIASGHRPIAAPV